MFETPNSGSFSSKYAFLIISSTLVNVMPSFELLFSFSYPRPFQLQCGRPQDACRLPPGFPPLWPHFCQVTVPSCWLLYQTPSQSPCFARGPYSLLAIPQPKVSIFKSKASSPSVLALFFHGLRWFLPPSGSMICSSQSLGLCSKVFQWSLFWSPYLCHPFPQHFLPTLACLNFFP